MNHLPHPRPWTSPLLTSALCATLGAAALQAKVYNFNDATQWDEFYRTGNNIWSNPGTGGLSNTPWAAIGSGNNSIPGMLVRSESFSATEETFTLGAYFFWSSAETGLATGSNDVLWLGIGQSGDPEKAFLPRNNGSDALAPESAQELRLGLALVNGAGNDNKVRPRGGGAIDGVRMSSFTDNNNTVTLTQDSWYYLELNFERAPISTGYTLTLNLYEATGTGSKGENILTYTTTQYNVALTTGELTPFVGSTSQRFSNVAGIDNLYLSIPEPSVTALAIGGLVFLGVLRLRHSTAAK
ncbi:MAG TPA: hypothetical protein VNQ90_09950 [Chthoniobacteraceae bacterium]|nr:hypothetical protein [Chthoniobacteraceae bacterium]